MADESDAPPPPRRGRLAVKMEKEKGRRWIGPTVVLALLLAPASLTAQTTPRVADERVILHTNAGDIVLALYPDAAPAHVAQFLKLVRLGVYDTTRFLRVIPGFLVQIEPRQMNKIFRQRPALLHGDLSTLRTSGQQLA